jgi:hypothetical protein
VALLGRGVVHHRHSGPGGRRLDRRVIVVIGAESLSHN